MILLSRKLMVRTGFAFLLLSGIALAGKQPCSGQYNPYAVAGAQQAELMRQFRDTSSAVKDYSQSHDHFPNTVSEMDELLKSLYQKVSMTAADNRLTVQTNGKFRTFYQFALGIDPSYKSVPIVNGVPDVSRFSSFSLPANTILLMTDGQDECVGLIVSGDGSPLKNEAGPVFFYHQIKSRDAGSGASAQ